VQREAFDWLDAPILQVAAEDVPLPYSEPLEMAAIPSADKIVEAALGVLHRRV
jgi:pyruvate dehydrogenase E1 component beta subunit